MQRDQLKKKEKFAGGATVKRVDDALDDLDDLMGDLNASRFGSESMLRQKRISNAAQMVSTIPPAEKEKERFSGGLTVKRVDDAVTDLDDLMGDMSKSRARRV